MSRIRIQLAESPRGKPILKVKDVNNREYETRELDLFFHDGRGFEVHPLTGQTGEDGRTVPLQITVMDPPQRNSPRVPTHLTDREVNVLVSCMTKENVLRLVERIRELTEIDLAQELEQ